MRNSFSVFCSLLVATTIGFVSVAAAGSLQEARTNKIAETFETIKQHPVDLIGFLRSFPKGGDIHTHLAGAVYAETLIDLGIKSGYCLGEDAVAVPPPCDASEGTEPLRQATNTLESYSALVDAWSVRNHELHLKSGFVQLFSALSRYDSLVNEYRAEALAEVLHRAADQNIQYIEIMVGWGMQDARELGQQLAWPVDEVAAVPALFQSADLAEILVSAVEDIDAAEAKTRQLLGCGAPLPPPGCDVTLRYLVEVIGVFPPAVNFAQLAVAFALVDADPRVLGINFVTPGVVAVRHHTFEEQMAMIGLFKERLPETNVTVHAGQLTLGLVPPRDLRGQIRQAIDLAGAIRIGHGTDLMYEDHPHKLLSHMADHGIAVETNLTSNAVVLGVEGDEHPFATYRRHGVPTALSTDDEGTLRIDLTHEYARATRSYDLTYYDLKTIARNSLTYSFLAGDSLWSDPQTLRMAEDCAGVDVAGEPIDRCLSYLEGSDKAAAQWRLERAFFEFEEAYPKP